MRCIELGIPCTFDRPVKRRGVSLLLSETAKLTISRRLGEHKPKMTDRQALAVIRTRTGPILFPARVDHKAHSGCRIRRGAASA